MQQLPAVGAFIAGIGDSGAVTIEVHWSRAGAPTIGAPDLATNLAIGSRARVGRLSREVQQRGYFQWHSWAQKDTLSPGRWIVSLTYPDPDGRPVRWGNYRAPCRLTMDVG